MMQQSGDRACCSRIKATFQNGQLSDFFCFCIRFYLYVKGTQLSTEKLFGYRAISRSSLLVWPHHVILSLHADWRVFTNTMEKCRFFGTATIWMLAQKLKLKEANKKSSFFEEYWPVLPSIEIPAHQTWPPKTMTTQAPLWCWITKGSL